MKHLASMVLLCLLLTACAAAPHAASPAPPQELLSLKTGIAAVATVSHSQNATYDFPGSARSDITLAAVAVDNQGIIRQCVLDGIAAVIPFDKTGALQLKEGTVFPSKNELGRAYGMHKASPQGREWNEQAAAYARWAVGRTPAQLAQGDVTTSVTVDTDGFLQAIQAAARQAVDQGAHQGDTLALVSSARMLPSRSVSDASAKDGSACCCASAAALTFRQGIVTSCRFDAVETAIPITPQGTIGTNPSLLPEQEDSCAVRRRTDTDSWARQAAAVSALTVGKSPAQALSEFPTPATAPDGTLPASASVAADDFLPLLCKAAKLLP